MIGDVGDEEKGGEEKSREHGRPVLTDAPCADEAETDDEGDGREGVEEGIECRKEEQVGALNIGRCMIIDEPAEEEAGTCADGDDGGDDAKRGTILLGRECRHGGKAKIIGFLLLPIV
jgi:hypothetical protein